ncbi:MAG: helix-turn-helix domain-containing protein [Paracoccaceae bacterium]
MIGRRPPPPEVEATKPRGFDDFDLRLGDVMRGERATMGKSLLDVQRELKIKATYIAAIENTDPTAFETQGFIAGYVRSYARYLGLDPEWAYNRFCEEGQFVTTHGMSKAASAKPTANTPAPKQKIRDPFADPNAVYLPTDKSFISRIEPGAVGSSLVLMLLIGVIGYGGWSVFQEIQKVEFAPVDQAPGVTSNIDVLEPSGSVFAAAKDTVGFEAPTMDALDRIYRPEALDLPVLVARDGPIATLDPSSVGSLPRSAWIRDTTYAQSDEITPSLTPLEAPVQVVAANVPDVVIFAVRPSWVRVQSVDGTVLFEKILDPGDRYVLPKTEEPPVLRAGNAGSVYFAVNGQNYGPAGTGPSVVKNVSLGIDALKNKYATADIAKDSDLARFVAVAQAQGLDSSE